METAKRLWMLRGLIVAARYGTLTLVGCADCVRAEARKHVLTNLVAGWWSIPWGICTPFVVLQNIVETAMPASRDVLEDALRKAGIDVDDVLVDSRGFSGEQRRMLNAAYAVLGRAILADGRVDPRELDVACSVISQLTGGQASRDEMIDALLLADPDVVRYNQLGREYCIALVRMAIGVVGSDGVTTVDELGYLRRVARMVGGGEDVLADLLLEVGGIGSTGQRRRRADSDLDRALTCLEISDPTDVLGIKAAYRRMMLRYHPDRAGGDKQKQAAHHRKAQEINWAYDYLRRYVGVR